MQDLVGVTCGCGQWGVDRDHDEESCDTGGTCDSCGETVSDATARTVDVRFDGSSAHAFRFCPACFVRWRDRFDRELVPSSRDDDSGIIVA
jgi:hypothetical protein